METLIDNCGHFRLSLHPGAVLLGESGIVVSFSGTVHTTSCVLRPVPGTDWHDIRNDIVNETVAFHQLRLTASSRGEEKHGLIIKVYAEQTYARAQYARAQQNELFVLRALVARGRAKATSRTAPWLKWLLGAGSLALPDELVRQVLGFWRPTE